jgi:hypothetical protein
MAKHIDNVNWNANNDKGIRGIHTPADHDIVDW